jgi:acyl carrier protein
MEQEFGVALPDDEMDQVDTVEDLYQCVIRNTPEDVSLQ